jgi:hypothetical protein
MSYSVESSASKVIQFEVKEVRLNDEINKSASKLASPTLKFQETKSPEKTREFRSPVVFNPQPLTR